MFGRKPQLKEGVHVFSVKENGDYNDFIFATVTGIEGRKVGVSGIIINPVGLKNKVEQGKTGERSLEILKNPTPDHRTPAALCAQAPDARRFRVHGIPPPSFSRASGP